MNTPNCFALLPLAAVLTIGAVSAESVYQDPQRRFTIAVPQGWSPSATEGSLQLARGNAFVTLFWMEGNGDAQGLVSEVLQQFSGPWKNLQQVGSSPLTFGGQPGNATVVVGINPRGVQSFAAVMAAATNGRAFVLIESGPMTEYKQLAAEMDHIAQSFSPAGSSQNARPATPQMPAPRPPGGGQQYPQNNQISQALVGHWTYYERGKYSDGSSSKELFLGPDGRFLYKAATYVPVDLPSGVNPVTEIYGSYRVQGNVIYYQPNGGQPGTFQFALLEGGRVLNIGGNLFIRE